MTSLSTDSSQSQWLATGFYKIRQLFGNTRKKLRFPQYDSKWKFVLAKQKITVRCFRGISLTEYALLMKPAPLLQLVQTFLF